MFFYSAYGCTVASVIPLPELADASPTRSPEISVIRGQMSPPELHKTESRCLCYVTANEAYLFWEDAGYFLVRNGREIILDLIPQADSRIVRLFLLGAAFGMVLHQRGFMTLHASTVLLEGKALLFVGDRGMGKSTTAAALMARGHRVLSDDIAALDLQPALPKAEEMALVAPLVIPGYPQLKLWADAATQLGYQADQLPRLHPHFDKHAHRYTHAFFPDPVPLQAIYVLGFGHSLEILPLPATVALADIMRNWYCARFGQQMLETVGMANHFQQCADLARRVPVYRLQRSPELMELNTIAHAVEQHFLQVIQPTHPAPA